MGSKFFAVATLVIMGVIAADVIAHPSGTTAAANGVAAVLRPTYSALLGKA